MINCDTDKLMDIASLLSDEAFVLLVGSVLVDGNPSTGLVRLDLASCMARWDYSSRDVYNAIMELLEKDMIGLTSKDGNYWINLPRFINPSIN